MPIREDGLRPSDVIGVFFVAGLVMLVAGAAAAVFNAVEGWSWGRWLALHLVFVGGVSQLILGASQFFAGAFLATEPPARRLIRAQWAGWNAGAVLLAVAVPLGSDALTAAAAALLVAALGFYAGGLAQLRRRSLGSIPWATRWYVAAAGFLAVGIVAGVGLATGASWRSGNLLAAHMALNIGGWFGAAIVGTLHTFFPSLTKSRLRFPRLQLPTFIAWTAGIACLAAGYAFSLAPVAVAGWLTLLLAAFLLLANLAGSLFAAPRPLGLAARLVGAAQPFLAAGLLVAAAAAIDAGPAAAIAGSDRAAIGTLLVAGWVGLTVAGSLLHLLPLLLRVRDLRRPMPQPRPLRDGALTAAAVAGVSGVALAQLAEAEGLAALARPLLLAAYVLLGLQIGAAGARVVRRALPRL